MHRGTNEHNIDRDEDMRVSWFLDFNVVSTAQGHPRTNKRRYQSHVQISLNTTSRHKPSGHKHRHINRQTEKQTQTDRQIHQ